MRSWCNARDHATAAVRVYLYRLDAGLSGGAVTGRYRACLRRTRHGAGCAGHYPGRIRCQLPVRDAQPPLRHHDQPDPAGRAIVRVDGRAAGEVQGRRDAARRHGADVRLAAGRAGDFRNHRRHAAGCLHRYRRRDRRHHGPAVTADHAQARLRPVTGHRRHLCHRHPGADHPAVHRAGPAGRRAVFRLSAGAAVDGHLEPEDRLGGRPVHRRADSGPDPGARLYRLHRHGRLAEAGEGAGRRS